MTEKLVRYQQCGDMHFLTLFTAAMALRFSDAFGTKPGKWLDLKQQYDLWHAPQRKRPKIEMFDRAA
jgi:plasmid maintenance system antidote protein VapI